ncbi:MAG: DUF6657 family protein [Desulfopila sp.]|nr:DUF6657 family protein [Desulfopila sp.]
MAEIRSTIDMVMERAARMAAESKEDTSGETAIREGMRLAAEYLQQEEGNLLDALEKCRQEDRKTILQGMLETLLRNIVLPRDQILLQSSMKALAAVVEIAPESVAAACSELQQLLSQYTQHKEQMKNQLDDAIRSQLEQKLAQQGTQLTEEMSINPAMHPQYKEELERMITGLNGQYNEALDQRKTLIRRQSLASL